MDLAHRLGVKPTIETVKRLEMAQQEMARRSQDPRPTKSRKHACTSQQPRGEAQGFTGKGKGKAKDEVEGYLNDEEMEEINLLDQPGDNNLGTMEFDVDNEVANAAGLTFLRQVQTTHE